MRLIDADALLEELKKKGRYFQAKFDIENAPTVEERPQGEWIKIKRRVDDKHVKFIFRCPFCGYVEIREANFCCNCGANMKGGQQNENL